MEQSMHMYVGIPRIITHVKENWKTEEMFFVDTMIMLAISIYRFIQLRIV